MTDSEKKTLKTALNIVAYSPCTVRTLCDKLQRRGYDKNSIKSAVEYVYKNGYINEKELLFRTVALRAKQGYGKRRILMYLKQKSFLPEIIDDNFDDACAEVDFVAYCRARIRQMRTTSPDKILASLGRYGYEYSVIKQALREELDEETEDFEEDEEN